MKYIRFIINLKFLYSILNTSIPNLFYELNILLIYFLEVNRGDKGL
jgi:hypothetical protein